MAKKKKSDESSRKVISGTHSTRIEHEDGTIDFIIDWDKLQSHVNHVLTEYENSVMLKDTKKSKVKKKNEA